MNIDILHYELLKLERVTPYYTEYLHSFKHTNKFYQAFIHHKLKQIESMCCDLLITPDGKCNWDNIDELKKRGYHVGPGERDGFGWLTAVLGTSKGAIVYG